MFACEHPTVAYEVSTRKALPFHFVIHTLRCTVCGTKAVVVNRTRGK